MATSPEAVNRPTNGGKSSLIEGVTNQQLGSFLNRQPSIEKGTVITPHNLDSSSGGAVQIMEVTSECGAPMHNTSLKIQDNNLRIEIDPKTGGIKRITDSSTGISLNSIRKQGTNWEIGLLPKEKGKRKIIGCDQDLSRTESLPDGTLLHWNGPVVDTSGEFHEISVQLSVTLKQGILVFQLEALNESQFRVAEVRYPILGGILIDDSCEPAAEPHDWVLNYPDGYIQRPPEIPLPADYQGNYPIWIGMPWIDISSRRSKRGIYFGNHDPATRWKTICVERDTSASEVTSGKSIGYFTWRHYPYSKPGESFKGPPVILKFHKGDWHQACGLYRMWFQSQFGIADPKQHWFRQLPAYQDVMFLLPEGNISMRFEDIPQYASDGLKYGMKAIMVSGWQIGGHDGWYPYYTPDPRLGTWEDLKAALDECHRMGVKVTFFVNISPVDVNTRWYKEELSRYQLKDIHGNFGTGGFGMGTVTARLGWTIRQLGHASPGFPEYRKIITNQMVKLAEIGADGLHIDKFHPAGLNFNPDLQVAPDVAETQYLAEAVEELVSACRSVNPDLQFSFETYWDWAMKFSAGATWHWGPMEECFHMVKTAFPEWTNTLSVTQPYDYTVVNNCVRYGYQLLVGPGSYTRSIGSPGYEQIAEYIRQVLTIWEELKDTIFLGVYLDQEGVTLSADPGVGYGVHRNPTTEKKAVVLVNYEMEPRTAVLQGFPGNGGKQAQVYVPGKQPRVEPLPLTLALPGERIAIVVEE